MWTALNRPRCQGGAPAAQRGRTTLTTGPRGAAHPSVGVEVRWASAMWLWCNVSTVMRMGWGQGRIFGCRSSLRPARGAWSGARATRGVNQYSDHAEIRGSDYWAAARVLRPRCSRRHLTVGHRADVSVAQPVVDEGEQLAGRGDLGDVAAAAGLDPLAIKGDLGGVGLALDGLHGRPPHEFAALLGDVPAAHDSVGFAVCGGQPGPRAQVGGVGE